MILATVNQPVLLSLLISDGTPSLYARAQVYDSGNNFITSISLPNVTGGLYQANYTPITEGLFAVIYELYTDVGFTIDAGYELQGETLDVNSVRTNIQRVLGLLHENTVVDQEVYDSDMHLLSARIRSYDNASHAAAAYAVSPNPYNTGLQFSWTVQATWSGGVATKYNITRIL